MAYRQRNVNLDYVDNLYWCAYLLFMVGDPGDTEICGGQNTGMTAPKRNREAQHAGSLPCS